MSFAVVTATAVLVMLYGGGFVTQIVGAFFVVREIIADVRAARALVATASERPAGLRIQQAPGVETIIRGGLGAALAGATKDVDTFREFTLDRLSGGLRRRWIGVLLIGAGAALELAANLIAVL